MSYYGLSTLEICPDPCRVPFKYRTASEQSTIINEITEEHYAGLRPFLLARRRNVRISNIAFINSILHVLAPLPYFGKSSEEFRTHNVIDLQRPPSSVLNEEIKLDTKAWDDFPDASNYLRLVCAVCAEVHESWLGDGCYPDVERLQEQCRVAMRKLAASRI